MTWVLEHYPAGSEWEKEFATKDEAVAELVKYICGECLSGEFKYVDLTQPGGFGVEKRKPPRITSMRDLLSTPCGCEYGISRKGRG